MPWIWKSLLVVGWSLLVINCEAPEVKKTPKAKKGIIDLRNWNFNRNDAITLDGEWKFFWRAFHSKKTPEIQIPPQWIQVPGNWNSFRHKGKEVGGNGFATYKLKVLLGKNAESLALKIGTIGTSYELEINGRRKVQVGKPAMNKANTIPAFHPKTIFLQGNRKELDLVLRVANFHHRRGGIWSSLVLGKSNALVTNYQSKLRIDWFLFGSILIMGIYHISLFLFRRKDQSPLWFGLYSFSIALLCITVESDFLYQLIPGSWVFVNKIEYLSYYVSSPLLTLFITSLYPQNVRRGLVKLILYIGFFFLAIVIFLPAYIYSYTIHAYEIFNVLNYFYLLVCIISAIRQGQEGSSVFLFGFSILYATVINDILYSQNIIYTGNFLLIGLTTFIFSQSIFLSMRFSYLFHHIEVLSSKLENSNKKLVKADKLKDEFLANTSHELKTPLHGIIGIAEALIDGVSGKLTKMTEKNLMNIVISGKRLFNLVNDILDFSKISNQDMVLEHKPVDIRSMGQIVITLMKPLIGIRPVKIFNRVRRNFILGIADENRLQQILINLVGNAIKFTHEGEITISAEQKGQWVYITVSDTGIGIAEDKQGIIFEAFQQADGSVSREYGGMGIGLSITKRLVELHHGTIFVESKLEKGSTFTFTIPASDKDSTWIPEEATLRSLYQTSTNQYSEERSQLIHSGTSIKNNKRHSSTQKRFILIVDDEPINIEVVKQRLFSLENIEFKVAFNGFQAIEAVQIKKPDLILLDIMMPRMSGYEVCEKLREKYKPNELPIILLTAKSETEDLVEGFNYGANDYITKPFTKSELISRINTHLDILALNNNLRAINKATSRFFPDDYLGFLKKKNIVDVNLGDHISKEMSVMFSDIRSFTNLSETMTPRENFDFVNNYLKSVSPIIRDNHGIIVKYLGDGMMALFSGSVEDAIQAGIEKLQQVERFNKDRGKAIQIGIGLNYGHMMMGLVGEENRMQGDAFSDNVNLAARIESLTRHYGVSFIITESVYNRIPDKSKYIIRFLDNVRVKGKDNAVSIYELIEPSVF
ncbi:MAG: ATP-binding protein [Spirochaetota bacterium]